jgi:hypothetical protein
MLGRLLRAILTVPLLLLAVWWTLALHFAGPRPAWLATSLAAAYAITIVAAFVLLPWQRSLAVYLVCLTLVWIWWSTLKPSGQKDWAPDVAEIPRGELNGDILMLHNVRNFDYRSETDFTSRYEDRTYDLSKLEGVDLFFSFWGSPHIAHTIMSWNFSDGPPLAISIETRKDKTQTYSAVEGFFRQYEICYVAADERDLIRLRTNFRGEDVYLYRLAAPVELARKILLDYVRSMNELVEKPEFYNALTDNCTTTIRSHVQRVSKGSPFDWRILANGHAPEMLYERGSLDTRIPFAELKARSRVTDIAKAAPNDATFSQHIRAGAPDPRAASPPRP